MGMVIAWPGRAAQSARRRLADDEPRGEILFFTGVRYERHDEPGPSTAQTPSKSGGGRSRRKRA